MARLEAGMRALDVAIQEGKLDSLLTPESLPASPTSVREDVMSQDRQGSPPKPQFEEANHPLPHEREDPLLSVVAGRCSRCKVLMWLAASDRWSKETKTTLPWEDWNDWEEEETLV
jgi:hypothetical protein